MNKKRLYYFIDIALWGQYFTHFEQPMHFSWSMIILPENIPDFSKVIAPVGQALFAAQKGDLSQLFSFKYAFFILPPRSTYTPYGYNYIIDIC